MKGAMSFMSKIIAVTSGKGGTGKSSISACLGYALAKQGNRTLIIELDFGLRCMDIMLGMQGRRQSACDRPPAPLQWKN